ncbi:hypothetical protein ACA910_001107 [Epithemia clementina (nom. ined.)]
MTTVDSSFTRCCCRRRRALATRINPRNFATAILFRSLGLLLVALPIIAAFPLNAIKSRRRVNEYVFTLPHPRYVAPLSTTEDSPNRLLTGNVPTVFAADPSDHRYAASDWLQNIRSLPRSTILRAIRGPVLVVVAWSTLISLVHRLAVIKGWNGLASSLCLSSRPHSFLVSALGLLLVFRTNSAYQRFAEGRQIWERIHSESRNLSRYAVLYEKEFGSPRLRRFLRLLAAFPYLLHQHVQPHSDLDAVAKPYGLLLPDLRGFTYNGVRSRRVVKRRAKEEGGAPPSTFHWVDRRAIPWCLLPPKALDRCVNSSNRPLWVCDRLSLEVTQVPYDDETNAFTSRERLQFLSQIGRLSQAVGQCERIHQTSVPLNYARHSLRSLTLWLFTLPFALVGDFGLLTGPVMGLAAWLLYGIYQIGYTIEDPFQGSLRLSILCDAIYQDVMYGTDQMRRRLSALEATTQNEEMSEWDDLDFVARLEEESGKSLSLEVTHVP